ncbi:hypothetical protein EG328_005177 [Venturia inaequalis]|uniref:Uncharacterized protein n=1 Tax=Venturia inaequalis TaxID=5025 RepID=A0A8H3UNX8_VENIN|nr:hypothetical protein EG328_005177 [Venturia inaequalis]
MSDYDEMSWSGNALDAENQASDTPVYQISAHCRHREESEFFSPSTTSRTSSQHSSVEYRRAKDSGLNSRLRSESRSTAPRQPSVEDGDEVRYALEESQYIICNITDAILDQLPEEQQDWILDFRRKSANTERNTETRYKLPVTVHAARNEIDSIEAARDETERPYHPKTLLYWTDGSFHKYIPRSAAGGIVFRQKNGPHCRIHISHHMRLISGSYDTELLTLIRCLRIGLQEANRRFKKGVFVREIVVYLDPLGLLWRIKDILYSESLRECWKEFFRVAGLCREAAVEVHVYRVPKSGRVFPHVLADEAAKGQNEEAERQARGWMEREEFDRLEFVPPIRDFVDFTDRTARERDDDEEDRDVRDWDEAWRQLRKWEILDSVME